MTRSRLLGAGLVLVLTIGLAAAPARASVSVDPLAPTTLSFAVTGHGFGHGRGLSQYGAQGAANSGLRWRQIIAFYYPGTSVGKVRGQLKVLITADTTRDVVVQARPGLRLARVGTQKTYRLDRLRPRATRWRIVTKGQRSVVTFKTTRPGGWSKLVSFPETAEFVAGNRPITLRLPRHQSADYRGSLRAVDASTVNVVSMETYLRGVVPREVPAEWPTAAVQAQSVAARSYAAYERATATGSYDICDSESCQVYGGYDDEHPDTDNAIRKTHRLVVTYQGMTAFTQFSSSNGGYSSAGSMPYLVAQADPYEAASSNPNANWNATITRAQIDQEWPQLGGLSDLRLTRDGHGEFGGRLTSVTLVGPAGTTVVSGADFAFLMGPLRSTYFELTPSPGLD